jgi:hypothetical protein
MNGDATFSDETLTAQRFCSAPLGAIQRLGARGNDDQRHDGIHNCGRRYRSSSGGRSSDGGNYAAGDRWTMTNWFSSSHSALDSSGNPSDFGGGDGGDGSGGGGGDGGGGG